MAVLAVSMIGSMVGNAMIAGTVMGMSGASIGWAVGSFIGSQMGGSTTTQGPRMADLKVTDSTPGGQIPKVYGTARVAGTVIWSTNYRETKNTQSVGGKGGPSQKVETFTYDMGLAVAFAVGPGTIRRLWLNGELFYDAGSNDVESIAASNQGIDGWVFYDGTEDQEPDPTIQSIEGVESTPAYRGIIYVVNPSLQLEKFGNRSPNVEAEIVGGLDPAEANPRILSEPELDYASMGSLVVDERIYQQGGGGFSGYTTYNGVSFFLAASNSQSGIPVITDLNPFSFSMQAINQKGDFGGLANLQNSREYTFNLDGGFVNVESSTANQFADVIGPYVSSYPQHHGGAPWIMPFYFGLGKVGGSQIYHSKDAPIRIGVAGLPMRSDYSGVGLLSYTLARPINVGQVGPNGTDRAGFDDALIESGQQGRDLVGLALASDGSCMIAFTAAPDALYADQWVKINVAGGSCYAVDQGTCDTADKIFGFGSSSLQTGAPKFSLEEDGVSLWMGHFETIRSHIVVKLFKLRTDKTLEKIFDQESEAFIELGLRGPSVFAKAGLAIFSGCISDFVVATRSRLMGKETVILGDIVADLFKQSGLEPEQFDVSQLTDEVDGFVVGNVMSARDACDPLRAAYFWDVVESGNILKCVKRGGPVVADIPEADLAAHDGQPSELPDALNRTRAQVMDLPQMVSVNYFSVEGGYQTGTQYARRLTVKSAGTLRMDLPICMHDDKAAQIALVNLYTQWQQMESFTWSTTRKWDWLDPTDLVTVNKGGNQFIVRITKRSEGGNGIINWEGVEEDPSIYTQSAVGGPVNPGAQTIALSGPTDLRLIDAPTIRDQDGLSPSLVFAANGFRSPWSGASLWKSEDEGATFDVTQLSFNTPSILGVAITKLAAPLRFGLLDTASFVDVKIGNDAQTLESISMLALLKGGNLAMIGGELVSFANADLIAPSTYRLSTFLRGQKGTEDKVAHSEGDPFAMMSPKALRISVMATGEIGQDVVYKAPTYGQSLAAAKQRSIAFGARNMLPLSPAFPNAFKNSAAGDWKGMWKRRTRIGGEWRDGVDVPLGETSEKYEVDIYSMPSFPSFAGSTKIRTIAVTSAEFTYTLAQQTADFGGAINGLGFKVYQLNDTLGRGLGSECVRLWAAPAYSGGYLAAWSGEAGSSAGSFSGMVTVTPAFSNLIPNMTSNTAPSGVASTSSAYFSTPAYCAFTDLSSGLNGVINNGDGFPWTLGYQHTTAKAVAYYEIYPWDVDNFPTRCPTSWKFQGSNDGSSWTDLDTQSSYTSWVFGTKSTFTPSDTTTTYLYHRIRVTANGGNAYTGVRRLKMFG